jgi:hypothetical protein
LGRFRDFLDKLVGWDFALQVLFLLALILAGLVTFLLELLGLVDV